MRLWTVCLLNIVSMNCLYIRCCVYELFSVWIAVSKNCFLYELLCLWNACLWNMSYLLFVISMCYLYIGISVYELSCRWNVWTPVESMIKYLNLNNDVFISQKRISPLFRFTKIQTYHLRIHSVNIKYAEQNLN